MATVLQYIAMKYCNQKKKDLRNTGIFVALKWFPNFCEKGEHFRGYMESD
jgi:hypothetical protein